MDVGLWLLEAEGSVEDASEVGSTIAGAKIRTSPLNPSVPRVVFLKLFIEPYHLSRLIHHHHTHLSQQEDIHLSAWFNQIFPWGYNQFGAYGDLLVVWNLEGNTG
ncbi:unnamed protein product [Bursaphelenchus xylophilus]|uniref:(pine wood nematode) hypothetical protein n=1 Tax=Bursaphelenchus xylophilus TaxID=6326 RepID=A0A7I8X067_BURXY|nr:unnamed protein product [Bursaphelenchus xylophilus]CAG9129826.1 unnamed protein product [Bursaphelenchus xylophilus]